MIKKQFLILICALSCLCMGAQITQRTHEASVKSIDEFMARFNGTERHILVDSKKPGAARQNLLYLFDAADTTHYKAKMALVDTVMARKLKLDYHSKMWYAEALCKMIYKKREIPVSIFLRSDKNDQGLEFWSVVSVKGLSANGVINDKKWGGISPVDHEVNFLSLGAIINNSKNSDHIAGYRGKDVPLDELSVFFALVQTGQLTFDNCEGVRYHFLDVPGFIFTVEDHLRDNTNSGWLITDVTEADRETKEDYLMNVLNLKQWYMNDSAY